MPAGFPDAELRESCETEGDSHSLANGRIFLALQDALCSDHQTASGEFGEPFPGAASSQGVIFLRQGSTEQCNETVPEQLADGASIGFDRVDQQVQRLAEIVPGLFRIRILQQRGRIADVDEQHAHLFVLRQHLRRPRLGTLPSSDGS